MNNYLIDGYNLGHKIPEVVQLLKKRDFYSAIERIVQYVQSKINARKNRVIIVFDGRQGVFDFPAVSSVVEIRFSRKPQEADDIIRDFLRKTSDTSEWIVVSSDLEILKTARDLGAGFIRSENFYVPGDSSTPDRLSPETRQKYDPKDVDIDYWLKMFGGDEEE
ncbi:MAG: NYN domain-containing protein [Calditrichaeota bacterium]|nr:NYN domain-containing protein [Calditrichota bacterium]